MTVAFESLARVDVDHELQGLDKPSIRVFGKLAGTRQRLDSVATRIGLKQGRGPEDHADPEEMLLEEFRRVQQPLTIESVGNISELIVPGAQLSEVGRIAIGAEGEQWVLPQFLEERTHRNLASAGCISGALGDRFHEIVRWRVASHAQRIKNVGAVASHAMGIAWKRYRAQWR